MLEIASLSFDRFAKVFNFYLYYKPPVSFVKPFGKTLKF